MDVLLSPQYSATRGETLARIAEIVTENLSEIGIKTTLDEKTTNNSDYSWDFQSSLQYQIWIGYCTPGVAQFETAFWYIVPNDSLPCGTCNIDEYNDTYMDMMCAADYTQYETDMKKLQQMTAEYVTGIGLADEMAYYPYRTDKYEGWVNFPSNGVINNQTWYTLHTIE